MRWNATYSDYQRTNGRCQRCGQYVRDRYWISSDRWDYHAFVCWGCMRKLLRFPRRYRLYEKYMFLMEGKKPKGQAE